MAGGWTRDGAVQDQIDDTVKDAVLLARNLLPSGQGTDECDDAVSPFRSSAARPSPACAPASPASPRATPTSVTPPSTAAEARTASSARCSARRKSP